MIARDELHTILDSIPKIGSTPLVTPSLRWRIHSFWRS